MRKIKAVFYWIILTALAVWWSLCSSLKLLLAEPERGAVDLNRLMWLGAGAGSKGLIAGMISGWLPQAGVAPEVASLLVGFWLAQQKGAWVSPFGEGMLIASIGQLVRAPIEGIFKGITQQQTPTTKTPTTTPTQSSYSSLDAYVVAKYGVA